MLKELLKLRRSWGSIDQIPEGYVLERAEAGDGEVCEFTPFDPRSVRNKRLRKALIENALLRIRIMGLNRQNEGLWLEGPFTKNRAYFRITKKQTPPGT